MMRLGFLGAQSSHALIFGRLINAEKRYDGLRVCAIWGGDDPDAAKEIAAELQIETVAAAQEALIECSDAVMILLRDGDSHAQWVKYALSLGKPVYIDKPFANAVHDALDIIELAKKLDVPLCGGSALRYLPVIGEIRQRVMQEACSHIVIRYSADPDSPFGGYHFYGCHLADLAVAMSGSRFTRVTAARQGRNVTALAAFDRTQALLLSSPETDGLQISVYGYEAAHYVIPYDDCYGLALEQFAWMLKTGALPVPYDELAATVALTGEIASRVNQI